MCDTLETCPDRFGVVCNPSYIHIWVHIRYELYITTLKKKTLILPRASGRAKKENKKLQLSYSLQTTKLQKPKRH